MEKFLKISVEALFLEYLITWYFGKIMEILALSCTAHLVLNNWQQDHPVRHRVRYADKFFDLTISDSFAKLNPF